MSRTIARFSSRVVRSASSTCRSWDFATSVTTGALESTSAATCGSSAATAPARRVAPKATSCAWRKSISSPGAGEELGVAWVGARPTALDEADAELVQVPGDRQLVRDGEVDALALRAVAQGGVEDVEGVAGGVRGHGSAPVGCTWIREERLHLSPFSPAPSPSGVVGRKTKKPLAGARGLRAGLGHGGRCRTRVRGAVAHCGPARLLPIIMANEGTVTVWHAPRPRARRSHDVSASPTRGRPARRSADLVHPAVLVRRPDPSAGRAAPCGASW